MAAETQPKLTRLGDLATVKARLGWKGLKAEEYVSSGCYFLATPNIKGPRIDFGAASFITQWRYDESPEIQLRTGDVLLVKDGSTLGIANLVRELPGPTTVNGSVAVVRSNPPLDPGYLFQYVQGPAFQDLIRLKKAGLGVPHLFQADLREFKLLLPELPEQRQIAAILDTIDDAIRKTEQIIAKLKQVKQGLLHDLLTRGIDANGELRDPERHPEQFKDSPLGRTPRGWEVTPLAGLVASAVDGPFGSNLKTEHYVPHPGVRVVRLQNIGTGLFLKGDGAYVSERHGAALSRHEVRAGDMLVASLGDDRHPFGRACVYPTELPPGIVKADCFRLRFDQLLMLAEFATHALNTAFWNRQLHGLGQGVTRDRVNLGNLLRVELPKPQLAEQVRTVCVLDAHQRRIENEEEARSKLHLFKQGLMEDLLTGRVRVTKLLDPAVQ